VIRALTSEPGLRLTRGQSAAATLIVGVSVLAGLTVGDPSPLWGLPLAIFAACAVFYASARWPFGSLLAMLGSSVLLVVVRVSGLRSVNLIDLLFPSVMLVSLFGRARRDALAPAEWGLDHDRLHKAERTFVRSVVVFYALALLSLVQLASIAGVAAALDSALVLSRAAQGLLFYPLCRWWLRTPARIGHAWRAIVVAGVILAVANLLGVALFGVLRAGMTLFLNNWDAPFKSPNEAGATTLFVGAVLLVRHSMRPDWRNIAAGALMLILLAFTQSRSAILAWAAFSVFTLRWVRPARLLSGALGLAALLALLPQAFWGRMARSVAIERGSFEAYSLFLRVYGWQTAWKVVKDHPLTGVGYFGFRFVSDNYNPLRLVIETVDNYYYETLVSMGVVGLAALVMVLVRLFQLGREVGRLAPAGTLAHHMARFHTPLMLGMVVANLTGDNFAGLVNHAQLALWVAVLVGSGHAAIAERPQA